ncbi:MAG: hypothetical protein JJE25_13675 [Bacteroidia bacterium]|nr:hypothetical protein [Bacteroidia bacterium]
MRCLISFLFFIQFNYSVSFAQCCAASGSCPIAGGASAGVLLEHQVEIDVNYQYVSTRKFLNGDADTSQFLDRYWSNYSYFRLAYGVTKDFTMSVEGGYYFNKTQKGNDAGEIKGLIEKSKGIADLIIFPRYDVINRSTAFKRVELTIGMGMKIPLGSYKDSTFSGVYLHDTIPLYFISPLAVQPSSGSNDFIFYAFFFRGFPQKNFRLFASSLYIKKGTNPLGIHFGDYATVGLYAGKTLFKNFGVTLQLKGEWIDKIKPEDDRYDLTGFQQANYNVDHYATGSKKIMFVPQLSYSYNSFTIFVSSEIPIYQYVNRVQIASQHFFTTGISYKFMAFKNKVAAGKYYCPMHPEETSDVPSKCSLCGMDLEKAKEK